MPFIPHTQQDIQEMLQAINIDDVAKLFDEIPATLPKAKLDNIPEGLDEIKITRLMQERVPKALPGYSFIGAGAYEHHIPAAVWQLVSRGEYYTAYTPYQAEASQGSLQLIYEYQTMMAHLMGMGVSNASMYDGATALAESVLMAVRLKKGRAKRIVVPRSINPRYRRVLQTILAYQNIVVEEVAFSDAEGNFTAHALEKTSSDGLAAVVIAQPNFFGQLAEVDALTDITHKKGAMVIAMVNPMAMALLKEPGQWGANGADIVCGEGQPLGIPLASGGPYFGFMCCKKDYVRQMPGRIVGRSTDVNGKIGYTLTLQAREQHIRRSKATSNICTNQGLMVTAATIYMSLMGASGLNTAAAASHHNANLLLEKLTTIEGVSKAFVGPIFHEFVLRLDAPVDAVLNHLRESNLQGGYSLKRFYPELGECLLVCATETKTVQDLERYQQLLYKAMEAAAC